MIEIIGAASRKSFLGHWQINRQSAGAFAAVSHEAHFLCAPSISA
jgi:hypothetical protein